MSLKYKIILFLLIFPVLLLAFYTFLTIESLTHDKIVYIYETEHTKSKGTGEQIRFNLLYLQEILTSIGHGYTGGGLSQDANQRFESDEDFLNLEIYEIAEGDVPELKVEKKKTHPEFQRDAEFFKDIIAQKSHLQLHSETQLVSFGTMAQLSRPSGVVRLVMVGLFKLPDLYTSLEEYEKFFVISNSGKVILDNVDNPQLRDFILTQSYKDKQDINVLETIQTHWQDRDYILSSTAVAQFPIKLVTLVDLYQAKESMRVLVYRSITAMLGLIGVSLFLSFFFSHRITGPLTVLASAAEDMAAGKYEFTWDSKSKDEINVLAQSFQQMGKKISDREAELEKVTELAVRDGMTGLYNHRHFKERYRQIFAQAKRTHEPLFLLLLDIDFFKKVNDNYGHQQGDEVIRTFAKLIQDAVRTSDIVARYGGEEFAVILTTAKDINGAVFVGEKIRKQFMETPIKNVNGGEPLFKTCSLGLAKLDDSMKTIEEMIERADQNLYKSKESGRNMLTAA